MMRLLLLVLAGVSTLTAATQPEHLDLRLGREPLAQVLDTIASQCDAGLVVHHGVQARLAGQTMLNVRKISWSDAARWLAAEHRLTMRLVGNHLEIGDADRAFRARLVTATYDLQSLTAPAPALPGPDLDIPEPGGYGSRLLPPIEPASIPEVNEFIELVQRQVAPDTWTIPGVAIRQHNESIVVIQVPEVQQQIAEFIATLERVAARQVIVRCHRLPAPDAATATATVLDATAWSAMAKDLGAPAGVVQVLDEQQNHFFSGIQSAMIIDADVNQEAFDPVVTVISQGLAIDVDTRVTHAGVVATVRFNASTRQKITTAPVTSTAGKVLVAIELPEQEHQRSRDTRIVPNGGAALYRFGDQVYALSFEVLEYVKKP